MENRAGQPASINDLVDIQKLLDAYHHSEIDTSDPAQRVAFGTSGHRGSSLKNSFNDAHIAAITQAIAEYRTNQGITGPLLLGKDTHALSSPAQDTALEVLAANGITVWTDARDGFTPTPALSLAILELNRARENGGHVDGQENGAPLSQVDGIVVTPSHNPPGDGGFKYNPPHGGPADSEATAWIANRANELLAHGNQDVKRVPLAEAKSAATTGTFDFLDTYVNALASVIDVAAIADSDIKIAADPLGGASVDYWVEIAARYNLPIAVVNTTIDPQWGFMTLDWDEKIRMDPSSPYAMTSLINRMKESDFDLAVGNDADADRHGIVTKDAGLMNPNHYLSVAIDYLYRNRAEWAPSVSVGKTLVSSSMIDRVVDALERELVEVPVGFKWFVPGLFSGQLGFGGEESAGASFLRQDGQVWTTDKDGILLALLAAEITAKTGRSPSQIYRELVAKHGDPSYARIDAPATKAQKEVLAQLSAEDVAATELAGEPILAKLTRAPGNDAPLGGLKVVTQNAWFAARPSGTEDVYKIYAESFLGPKHLELVQAEAKQLVDGILAGA